MAKIRIEIPITFLTLIITAAVITIGYLGYKSLSQIVDSIHQAARPDNKLFLIKSMNVDLSELENNVRMYVLTDESQNNENYKVLYNSVQEKINQLNGERNPETDFTLLDSVISLSYEKLDIWEGVLKLHESAKGLEPVFTEIYSKIEEQRIDTVKTERRKKFLGRLFSKEKVEIDTAIYARDLQKNEIRQEIRSLESQIKEKGEQLNILESLLIEQNLGVSEQLNNLIIEIEKKESAKLIQKTEASDRLAGLTYQRLAIFSITTVVLLLLVLFLLFNYLRKSRRYENMLKSAKAEAEDYARAKEQFAANVSHEIRTPINAIYGLSEQLLQKQLAKDAKEQLIVLSKSALHLKNIVNDTLDFSKIQANKVKFDLVHFSPTELFNEIIAIERSEAHGKGLELKFKTSGKLPDALIGDPLRLKQILLNLINNSMKFTDSGSILLLVEPFEKKDKKVQLNIVIEDTGIGISEEEQKIIFEEFVQAENTTDKKYKGTGLGLSIVKKLVELQGGNITVESAKGQGAKFKVSISYSEGDPEKIQGQDVINIVIPGWFKNLSVLVADDEEFNRFLLKGIFEKWGVQYYEVDNGADAVVVASETNYDIVFMDLHMPRKNGIEATKQILKEKPETIIVAITASNDQLEVKACIGAGMVDVLTKPFSELALFEIINKNHKPDLRQQPDRKKGNEEMPVIDFSELKRLTNNDETFFREMLEIFIRSTESGIDTIDKEMAAGKLEAIAETAHKMAAPCKHISSQKLYPMLSELEIKSREKKTGELAVLISNIKSEIEDANRFIRDYLGANNL